MGAMLSSIGIRRPSFAQSVVRSPKAGQGAITGFGERVPGWRASLFVDDIENLREVSASRLFLRPSGEGLGDGI